MIRKRRAAKLSPCPSCGSTDLARIMYGLPMESAALTNAIERREVVLGGCCVTGDDPEWRCNACDTDFSLAAPSAQSATLTPLG